MMIVDALRRRVRGPPRRLPESTPSHAIHPTRLIGGVQSAAAGVRTRVASVDGHAGHAARTLRRARVFLCRLLLVPAMGESSIIPSK